MCSTLRHHQNVKPKAMTHLASMGITRIGVVYTDDSFGADGPQRAHKRDWWPPSSRRCCKKSLTALLA